MDRLIGYAPYGAVVLFGIAAWAIIDIAVSRRNIREGRVWLHPVNGRTVASSEISAGAVFVLAATALLTGIIAVRRIEPDQIVPAAGLLALSGGCGVWLWIWSRHRWEWDEVGIRWIGVFRSSQIAWADVVAAGRTRFGEPRYFVKSHSGRRIWWSKHVLGYFMIEDAARTWRPDLYGLWHKPGSYRRVIPD